MRKKTALGREILSPNIQADKRVKYNQGLEIQT